jgi:FtsZ-interacting cell division protein ZipA
MVNISELQISLIAIGFVVVIGVIFFNWMQQRRYRRGAEEAFARKHEDVLLRTDRLVAEDERIEPQLGTEIVQEQKIFQGFQTEPNAESAKLSEIARPNPESIPVVPAPPTLIGQVPVNDESVVDVIDYIIRIHAEKLIADSNLREVLQRKFDFSKPVRWLGQRNTGEFWEEITTETIGKGGYVNLKGCLQLADRAGPVSEVSLSEFRDMAQNFGAHVNAVADCPDVRATHAHALLLDHFCAEVDIMIGINIISKDTHPFTGAKICVLAESSGFELGADGVFTYRNENTAVLFSLNSHGSSPFLPGNLRTLTTHGITFLLDVPRVANGEKIFDQMMHFAGVFSDALGGIMVDDNRVPLSDSGIGKIKRQLSAIQSMMMARNIPPGGKVALRLFRE